MTAIDTPIRIGIWIIAIGFLEIAVLTAINRIKPTTIATFGLLVIFGGAVVANLTGINKLAASFAGGNLEVDRTVVETDTAKVIQISDDLQALEKRVQASEKNVTQMRDLVQEESRSLLEMIVFIVDSTQHQMPIAAFNEFIAKINRLSELAYPNKQERQTEMTRISSRPLINA
jgi:hypothetical protein